MEYTSDKDIQWPFWEQNCFLQWHVSPHSRKTQKGLIPEWMEEGRIPGAQLCPVGTLLET